MPWQRSTSPWDGKASRHSTNRTKGATSGTSQPTSLPHRMMPKMVRYDLELQGGEKIVLFDDAMREAAHAADEAVQAAVDKWQKGGVTDEDDISPYLIARLDARMDGMIGGLKWNSAVLRHRKGIAAQEKKTGADLLLHVSINTNTVSYSKGVLVQAKKSGYAGTIRDFPRLRKQCDDMLKITPSSFVFNYGEDELRCASATKVAGSKGTNLRSLSSWTSYRFFLEFFRCPVGDGTITSERFDDLAATHGLRMEAEGDVD